MKCAFGVDETLVGECTLLKRYVLRRRDARWRVQLRGKIEYLTHRPRLRIWRPEKMVFGVGETFVFWRNIFLLIGVSVTFGHPQAARLGSARLGSPGPPGPRNFCAHGPGARKFCPAGPARGIFVHTARARFCPRAPSTRQIRRIFVHAPGLRRLISQLSY